MTSQQVKLGGVYHRWAQNHHITLHYITLHCIWTATSEGIKISYFLMGRIWSVSQHNKEMLSNSVSLKSYYREQVKEQIWKHVLTICKIIWLYAKLYAGLLHDSQFGQTSNNPDHIPWFHSKAHMLCRAVFMYKYSHMTDLRSPDPVRLRPQ